MKNPIRFRFKGKTATEQPNGTLQRRAYTPWSSNQEWRIDTYRRRYTIGSMKKISLYLEEEQLAKLTSISENFSVALPLSNQIRAAIDDYCKARSRYTRGWESRLRKMKLERLNGSSQPTTELP
jgi:hypothetical protein